jgi:hypothetical protein
MPPCRYVFPVLLALSLALTPPGRCDDDDADADEPAEASQTDPTRPAAPSLPAGTVRLTAARQQAGGLVVEPLRAVTFQPEAAAYGKVLDIQPLLELRVRYRAAEAEAEVAKAALELARKNHGRLSTLHREDIVAGRELMQAETRMHTDRAREAAARRLLGQIREEARQAWGDALTRLALDGDAPLFEQLVSHRRLLLLVVLPPGVSLAEGTARLYVNRDPDRAQAVAAERVSPAPRTDDLVQGESWFFHAAGEKLRSGMRVHAWVPLGGGAEAGVVLPLSAVVWHAGKPWAYRQVDGETYARVEIVNQRDYGSGWFVENGFAAGERVVTTGGQMLLSEEFRGQIPDEDDD